MTKRLSVYNIDPVTGEVYSFIQTRSTAAVKADLISVRWDDADYLCICDVRLMQTHKDPSAHVRSGFKRAIWSVKVEKTKFHFQSLKGTLLVCVGQ